MPGPISKNIQKNLGLVFFSLSVISIFFLYSISFVPDHAILGQNQNQTMSNTQIETIPEPSLIDSSLSVEKVADGFDFPTGMEFIGNNDILLIEKNSGNILRILNGNVTHQLLHIDVSFKDERGLLGISISNNEESSEDDAFVYLYFSLCIKDKITAIQDCGNYVYRYELDARNNELIDPKLILSLPGLPGPSHNGGRLLMDKEKNLFVTIGDLQSTKFNQNNTGYDTKSQNIMNGTSPDGRAGILRITQDGQPVGTGILGDNYPLNLYYAYGIKNSFGIAIDPLTGNL